MMAYLAGVDKDLEDALLHDLSFFLALAALKGWVDAIDEEAEVREGSTLL